MFSLGWSNEFPTVYIFINFHRSYFTRLSARG
jgi:hypothetical protein